jgi:hypothetical protein
MNHHTSDYICSLCEEKLKNAHRFLAYWFHNYVKLNWPDAHVSCSHRNKYDQEWLFIDKKTELHWPNSKHNKIPAEALDLFQINDKGKGIWDVKFFTDLNQHNLDSGIDFTWGGNFEKLRDYCHFEMKEGFIDG